MAKTKTIRRIGVNIKLPADVKAWIERQVDDGRYKDIGHVVASLVRESRSVPTIRSWDELDGLLAEAVASGPPRPITSRDWARLRQAGENGVARRRADDRVSRRSA